MKFKNAKLTKTAPYKSKYSLNENYIIKPD